MEAEMRTQLRRQAAAHTDHVQDVLKVQEQELKGEAEQVSASSIQLSEDTDEWMMSTAVYSTPALLFLCSDHHVSKCYTLCWKLVLIKLCCGLCSGAEQ